MNSWWYFYKLLTLFIIYSEQSNIQLNKLLYNKNGNVSIIGLINSFSGNECTTEAAKGLQETASAIWTVETLNNFHYLPGITIGLSVFDACHFLNTQKIVPEITGDAQLNENSTNIGILMSQDIYKTLHNFKNLNSNIMQLNHIISSQLLVESTLQLLINLQWTTLKVVVSDSRDILNLFKKEVAEERIKVEDYLLISKRNLHLQRRVLGDNETASVIVVIAAFTNISDFGENVLNKNFKLIITPTDFTFELKGFPNETIVLLPSMESKGVLSKYIKNTAHYKNFFSHKGPTKSPLFIGTAVNILKLLRPVKNILDEHCGNVNFFSEHPCARAVDFIGELIGNSTTLEISKSSEISPDEILETLDVLKIKPSFNDEMFLYIASVLNSNVSEDVSIFRIFSTQTKKFRPVLLKLNDNLVRNREMFVKPEVEIKYNGQIFEADVDETKQFTNSLIRLSQNFPTKGNFSTENVGNVTLTETTNCNVSQDCKNDYPKSPNSTTAFGWRFLTWVCINTALACTGITCTLSVMLFIFIRVFKGDNEFENSLWFNLLLMVSVIFMYASSTVFHIEYLADNRLLCFFRMNAPPVVCALLFSLLLSRSIMLAFSECSPEFGNHINGYLHSILCIFMISLQGSLTIQNRNFGNADVNCSEVHNQYRLIIALSYNFFLIIFLACVSPFIICSKRNNKEGLLISISVFFVTVIWSAWICFYILFSSKYKDAAVAIGLNLTATVIVLCILIPRIYLMTITTVQNSASCYISTLGKLTGGLNINSQSSQTLHDSAVEVISYRNCELGTSNPNFYSNRPDEGNRVGIREPAGDICSETVQ